MSGDHPADDELAHVHLTHESVATIELTPAHAPRVETEAYRRARHFLIEEQDRPCTICGARRSAGAELEAHHHPIERSLVEACDPVKVHADFPQVYDRETLEAFADSPANLIILCARHHRDPECGIHHLTAPDFIAQKYLRTGYRIAARNDDAATAEAADERLTTQEGS